MALSTDQNVVRALLESFTTDAQEGYERVTYSCGRPLWAPEQREMIMFLRGARYWPRPPHMEKLSLRTGRTWKRRDPSEPRTFEWTQICTELA